MNNNIVQFEDLRNITGYKPVKKVAQSLDEQGIKYIRTEKGIFTTVDQINAAMSGESTDSEDEYTIS